MRTKIGTLAECIEIAIEVSLVRCEGAMLPAACRCSGARCGMRAAASTTPCTMPLTPPRRREHHHPRRLPGRGAQAASAPPSSKHLNAKVFTNTVKGIGQLSVRLRDADVLVLIRERTQFPRQLLEKLPKLKLISQTGRVGAAHRHGGLHAARHRRGRGRRLAGRAGRADLGADHGGDAAAAAVHRQPEARRLAAVGAEGRRRCRPTSASAWC